MPKRVIPHNFVKSMQTLRDLSLRDSSEPRRLPDGRTVTIDALVVHFRPHPLGKLPEGTAYFAEPTKPLPRSYLSKPLVDFDGDPLFGELAVARCLIEDGWRAVWVDSYHGRGSRLCWTDLPDRSAPYDFADAPHAAEVYEHITEANGGSGGWFDVFAWRDSDYLFVEYKGAGDTPNTNERRWIMSALDCGMQLESLHFVLH